MGNSDAAAAPAFDPDALPRQSHASGYHSTAEAAFHQAEERIEAHSIAFKKELGLFDLVLAQILIIVTYNFVGTAGKLGSSHLLYWIPAVVLFYIPLAAVVSYLNRLMPLEGGLYQWAKLGFNNFMGFFVAWNIWLYVVVYLSSIGLEVSTYLSYAVGSTDGTNGSTSQWIATDKVFITALSCAIVAFLVLSSVVGMQIGKVVYNVGSVMSIGVFVLLIALPFVTALLGHHHLYNPFAVTAPTLSLFSLNILTKMAFGALCGFEHVAVFAGECRQPARSIGRSVAIAAPIIALMYILGTSSLLAFNTPDAINLIGPLPQALSSGLQRLDAAAAVYGVQSSWLLYLAPATILMLALSQISYGSILLAGMARLPMVAGWDSLLPAWFTKLHPTYHTPVNSVIFVGIITLVVGVVSIIGVGEQEAFQLLVSASFIFYAITYVVMFAVPLLGLKHLRHSAERPSWRLRLAAVLGGLVSIAFIVLSLFPIVDVDNPLLFGAKLLAVMVVTNAVGVGIYYAAKRRS